jgi:hypothetical protein
MQVFPSRHASAIVARYVSQEPMDLIHLLKGDSRRGSRRLAQAVAVPLLVAETSDSAHITAANSSPPGPPLAVAIVTAGPLPTPGGS